MKKQANSSALKTQPSPDQIHSRPTFVSAVCRYATRPIPNPLSDVLIKTFIPVFELSEYNQVTERGSDPVVSASAHIGQQSLQNEPSELYFLWWLNECFRLDLRLLCFRSPDDVRLSDASSFFALACVFIPDDIFPPVVVLDAG